jgi:TonB family protein
MRALAPVLFLLVATQTCAQSTSSDSPTPAPSPCAEAVKTARCECGRALSGTLADAGFPRAAAKAGVHSGKVVASFLISSSGEATDIQIIESTHEVFADAAKRLLGRVRCSPEAAGVRITLPFSFKLE